MLTASRTRWSHVAAADVAVVGADRAGAGEHGGAAGGWSRSSTVSDGVGGVPGEHAVGVAALDGAGQRRMSRVVVRWS